MMQASRQWVILQCKIINQSSSLTGCLKFWKSWLIRQRENSALFKFSFTTCKYKAIDFKGFEKIATGRKIEVFYLQHVKVDTPNLFVIVCAPILILVILVVGTMPECKIKLWRKNWIHIHISIWINIDICSYCIFLHLSLFITIIFFCH